MAVSDDLSVLSISDQSEPRIKQQCPAIGPKYENKFSGQNIPLLKNFPNYD